MNEKFISLTNLLTELHKYDDQLKSHFEQEVRAEAAVIAREHCQSREFVLEVCLRDRLAVDCAGTMLRMLCELRRVDPGRVRQASRIKPGDEDHAEALAKWRSLLIDAGMGNHEAHELFANGKPYNALGVHQRSKIDRLLKKTAFSQKRLFESPNLELLQRFEDDAKKSLRERAGGADLLFDRSNAWLDAIRWLAQKTGIGVEETEGRLPELCSGWVNERCVDEANPAHRINEARSAHALAKRRNKGAVSLAGEITALDTPKNYGELLHRLWKRRLVECLEIPLPCPPELIWGAEPPPLIKSPEMVSSLPGLLAKLNGERREAERERNRLIFARRVQLALKDGVTVPVEGKPAQSLTDLQKRRLQVLLAVNPRQPEVLIFRTDVQLGETVRRKTPDAKLQIAAERPDRWQIEEAWSAAVGWLAAKWPAPWPKNGQSFEEALDAYCCDYSTDSIEPTDFSATIADFDAPEYISSFREKLSHSGYETTTFDAGNPATRRTSGLPDDTNRARKVAGNAPLDVDFPNPSSPVSKKCAADTWGGGMTVSKLTKLMKSGRVRYKELTRQCFILCRDDAPGLPAR